MIRSFFLLFFSAALYGAAEMRFVPYEREVFMPEGEGRFEGESVIIEMPKIRKLLILRSSVQNPGGGRKFIVSIPAEGVVIFSDRGQEQKTALFPKGGYAVLIGKFHEQKRGRSAWISVPQGGTVELPDATVIHPET